MRWILSIILVVLAMSLVACAEESDPSETVPKYLQAKIDGDIDGLRALICSDMESTISREAFSFDGVDASLQDVSCTTRSTEGGTAVATCEGHILAIYGVGEENEIPLTSYALAKEDGEWKWCGEAE